MGTEHRSNEPTLDVGGILRGITGWVASEPRSHDGDGHIAPGRSGPEVPDAAAP